MTGYTKPSTFHTLRLFLIHIQLTNYQHRTVVAVDAAVKSVYSFFYGFQAVLLKVIGLSDCSLWFHSRMKLEITKSIGSSVRMMAIVGRLVR